MLIHKIPIFGSGGGQSASGQGSWAQKASPVPAICYRRGVTTYNTLFLTSPLPNGTSDNEYNSRSPGVMSAHKVAPGQKEF